MRIDMTITGLQVAQQANLNRIRALQPEGALGDLVREVTVFTHRQAVIVTHVDTGSLRSSHRIEVRGLRGRVYIDPSAINPRTGEKPRDYGEIEHNRGGDHAFYTRARQATTAYLRRVAQRFQSNLAAGNR